MITEYKRDCRYMVGNLKGDIYLYPSDTKFDYNLDTEARDDTDAIITNVSQNTAVLIHADYANFSESSAIDSRFSFSNTLTVRINQTRNSFHSDILKLLSEQSFFIAFENTDGQMFLMSPEYTSDYTFTYTMENESSYLEVVFSVDSNMNAMWIAYSRPTILSEYNLGSCSYKSYHVRKLEIGCSDEIMFEGNKVWMESEDSLCQVDFIANSVTLIDSDTSGYEEVQLQFSIPFDNYKYYFHYNLLEFVKNTYSCIVYTDMGNCVFVSDLFPSYTISTSESEGVLNTVQITLRGLKKDATQKGFESVDEGEIDKDIADDKVSYAYVSEYDMCINAYEKAHLLVAQLNFKGQYSGKYYCLEGYESMFQNYNIVGTYGYMDDDRFGFDILYTAPDCSWMGGDGCKILGIPATINFLGKGTKTYQCNATCSFDILEVPNGFYVEPLKGIGDVEISITNEDETSRTDFLELKFPDSSTTIITLNVYDESDIIDRWEIDGTICSDSEIDNGNCFQWRRVPLSVNDPSTYICQCGDMYYRERKYISVECDGENFTETNEYRMGDLYMENADACLELCEPIYTVVEGEYFCEQVGRCYVDREVLYDPSDPSTYVCDGVNLCHVLRTYYQEECGSGEYIPTDEYKLGSVIQYNSNLCGHVAQERREFQAYITSSSGYFQFMINNKQYRMFSPSNRIAFSLTTYGVEDDSFVSFENIFNYAINFDGEKLQRVFSLFNTARVTSMYGAFAYQDEMTVCDLSYANIFACDNISYMFKGCTALTDIYFDNWAILKNGVNTFANARSVFDDCTSLKRIYMRGASTALVSQIRNCLMESDIINNVTIITE